jgi:hypothetical protein
MLSSRISRSQRMKHASSASRHHAAGARRRSRRRIPRDSQILTAMTAAVRATTYNEHIMLTETNPIPNRAADCPGPTNHNGVSRCPASGYPKFKNDRGDRPSTCRLDRCRECRATRLDSHPLGEPRSRPRVAGDGFLRTMARADPLALACPTPEPGDEILGR